MSMNTHTPKWLTPVAGLGIIWYAFGLAQFFMAYTMDVTVASSAGTITPTHAAAISGTPFLIWISFAIASAAGLVGAALLIFNRTKAFTAFVVSLISAAVYYIWVYGLSGTGADRPSEELIIAAVVFGVTVIFSLISRRFR